MVRRLRTVEEPPLRLDPAVADLLRSDVGEIAQSMITAITGSVPEYAALDRASRESVRQTAETAISIFIDRLEAGLPAAEPVPSRWQPGLGAWRAGRSLEALQAAFRVAARAAWTQISATTLSAGVDAETISGLAGALFAAVERVAAHATDGFARAQADAAGEREANRLRLAALLTRDPPVAPEASRRAADRAGWQIPTTLTVIALGDRDDPRGIAARIGPEALTSDPAHCVIVPDPGGPGRRAQIDRACDAHQAAVGPPVAPQETLRSLAWARETLALVLAGELPAPPPPRAEENLLTLALARGRDLIGALEKRHGLDDVALSASRIDLHRTLLVWLANDRSATAAAEILHLHPQTVRYRIARARELVGSALDDPEARFELEAVLRARLSAGTSGE